MYKLIAKYVNKVSTPPARLSWQWNDSVSILSFIGLHLIYVLRSFSLLQILKLAYRSAARRMHFNSIDRGAKRANIPVWFVEVYFISVLVITMLMPYNSCTKWVFIFFMVESIVWLIYYNIFRRFFEENYSIVHALEYMILIPVVFTLQASCFASLTGHTIVEAIKIMLCPSASADCPIYIIVLFVLYTAIILSLVLTNLPAERIKMNKKRPNFISVIGAGDIVQNRLLPILIGKRERICIIDEDSRAVAACKDIALGKPRIKVVQQTDDNLSDIDREIMGSNILWIATPPMSHITYLEEWIGSDIFIVVEKPLISLKQEFALLDDMMSHDDWDNVFSLSYYYLEKALPLTYIYSPLKFYEKYLHFSCGKSRCDVLSLVTQLGEITHFEAKIIEGEDDRPWANIDQYGGQYMETFIHVAMLTKLVFGQDADIDNAEWNVGRSDLGAITEVGCRGAVGDATVDIGITKFADEPKRYCKILYEQGEIMLNFDDSICKCHFYADDLQDNNFDISIEDQFVEKYSIQYDMVTRCYNEHIRPSSIDGSKLQQCVIAWLFEHQKLLK